MQLAIELFEPKRLARSSDPETSQDAAAHAREFAPGQCEQVYKAGQRFGCAGAEQIAAATHLDAYQVRKRLADLHRAGRARPTDRKRITATGRRERVWEFA